MILESVLSNQPFEYQKLTQEEMESRGILGRLVGVIADYTNPTRNGRAYKESLWDTVFSNPIMEERITNRCCFGELGHPTDREETDMSKIAICLAETPVKKDGKLYGVFDIINSPNGRILKTLCDYGCNIGISSRGSGDLIQDFDGNESVDPDTYNCEGWDAVLIPAVKEARLKYVNESLEKTRYKKSLRTRLQEAIDKADEDHKKSMTESLHTFLGEGIWDEIENDIEEPEAGPEPDEDFVNELDQNIEGGEQPQEDIIDEPTSEDGDILDEPSDDTDIFDEPIDDMDMDAQIDGLFGEPAPEDIEYKGVKIIQDPDTGKFVCEIDQEIYVFNSEKNAKIWIDMNKDQVEEDNMEDAVDDAFETEEEMDDLITKDMIEEEPEEEPMQESLNEEQEGRDTHKDDKDADEVQHQEERKEEDSSDDEDEKNTKSVTITVNESAIDESILEFEKLLENLDESTLKYDENVPKKEADNIGSEVDSLKEMLDTNIKLEKKVIELQEKLSVSHAEESRKLEEIASLKDRLAKLSQVSKENKALKEQLKTMKSSSTKLNESLDKNSEKAKKLNEQLKTVKEERDSAKTELEGLREDYSSLEKDSTQLKEQLNKKLDRQNKLLEKYQKITKNAVDRYITLQATNLGVKPIEIKNKLPEKFSFGEIDSICEELRDYKLSVSKLPFSTSKSIREGNVRVNNLSKGLTPRNEMDELTDFDLKMMELFK